MFQAQLHSPLNLGDFYIYETINLYPDQTW